MDYARNSPYPDPKEALENVLQGVNNMARKLPMYMAISEGIAQEMERDNNVL